MTSTQTPEREKSNLPVPGATAQLPVAAGETSSSAIAARERAAVEARFLVAMNRPRNFDDAFARLRRACERPAFAEVARYAKPVGGKDVYGLSIRFAEEARVLWGNMDVSSFLVFDDDERRIYRVIGTDLETNATDGVDVMVEKFVERRSPGQGAEIISQRQNKQGQVVYRVRATEDDLLVKVNNQMAKARRNVILSLVPADVKEECEQRIIDTMENRDAKDPDEARKRIVDLFFRHGVSAKQLSDLLGHPLEQCNPAELAFLRSYYTSLKEGESTWADIVEAHQGAKGGNGGAKAEAPSRGAEGLKSALGNKTAEKKAPPTPVDQAAQSEFPCEDCGAAHAPHRSGCAKAKK